jgi:hypothetical protein
MSPMVHILEVQSVVNTRKKQDLEDTPPATVQEMR